jgi:hypothetical protein
MMRPFEVIMMRSRYLVGLLRPLPLLFLMLGMVSGLCSSPASAQTFYGSIVGTVSDATGAVMPGATVIVTDIGTAEKHTAQSNASGDYRFVNLVPSTYSVQVDAKSFKRFVQDKVEVAVDSTIRVDVRMVLGAATETVEVSTDAPILQTESGSLGAEIEGKTVQEMPLNGRNTLNLMELVPGVVPQGNTSGSAAMNNGSSTSSAAWGNYQIGGGMPLQSSMYVDGAPINIMNKNFTVLVPAQDTIQEFKVETSAASPEFGRFGGGVVNMTTKSGSNAFHGTLYEYLRNNILNANYFYSKRSGAARPQWTQNQYGGTVGGPIWKNKAFFFFAYEQISIRTGVPTLTNVPTAALQAGVFSTKITDPQGICNIAPYTGQTINGATFPSGGYYITNLYGPGLKPNTTCGDPTAKIFATFYPLPNNLANTADNYFTTLSEGDNGHQMTGRVDYDLSSKQRIFGRFTLWPLVDEAPNVMHDAGGWNSAGSQTHNHTNQVVAGDTYTFNPTTLLDVRADYIRQYGDAIPPGFGNVNEAQFGAAYSAFAPFMTYKNLPSWSFGAASLHNLFNFSYNNLTRTYYNNYHISVGLTKILGKHTLKVGAEARLIQRDDVGSDQAASGSFAFTDDLGGDEWANFLMGAFDSGAITTVKAVTSYNFYNGYYIGDTWQAAPKLTLNLGVRWELPGAIAENGNNLTVLLPNTVDPNTGITGTAGLVASSLYGRRTSLIPHDHLFGPRLGFAYRLTNSTAIRGGYSLSYLSPDLQIGAYANASLVTSVTTTNKNSATAVAYTTSNPFPATTQYPNGFQAAPGRSNPAFMTAYIGQAVSAPYPIEPYPESQQMNLSIGHQMRGDLLIDVGYAHTLGTHLPSISAGLDQLPDQYDSMGSALLSAAPSSISYDGVKLPAAYQTVGQTLRPFPAYTNYSNATAFHGTTTYDSLELKLLKRFKSTGQIGVAYAWMKMLGDTDTVLTSQETKSGGVAGSGEGVYQDYYNPRADRSMYSYDVPNRLVIDYVLNLPFGRGQRFGANTNGVVSRVISGWSMNGITTLESGYPVYLYIGTSNLNKFLGAGTIRPNYSPANGLCSSTKTNALSGFSRSLATTASTSTQRWFNTDCFTNPGLYAFGNEPRTDDAIKSSGVDNFDFSVVKSTPIREQVALQFRVEFFNIFNRVQFGPPVTAADNSQVGLISNQANQPRLIQGALRLNF